MNETKEVLLKAARTSAITVIRNMSYSKTFSEAKELAKDIIKEVARMEAIEAVFAAATELSRPVRLHFSERGRLRNESLNLITVRFAVTQDNAAICVETSPGLFVGASLAGLVLDIES